MKKEIYSQTGYQHGLFSKGNFERYLRELKMAEFVCGYNGSSTRDFAVIHHLSPSGLTLSYLRGTTPSRNLFAVTVSLTGNRRKISQMEQKILRDAAKFKSDQKRERNFRASMSDDRAFMDDSRFEE
jgi:hypothetical protein